MSDLSDLLTLLIKKRGNERLAVFYEDKKITKKSKTYQNYDFSQFFWANHSCFFVSERANERFDQKKRSICSFAHLSWTTWANRLQWLICYERSEQSAHSCSFVLSNMNKSLTVAHLIWAIWVNERWVNEQIPYPGRKWPVSPSFLTVLCDPNLKMKLRVCDLWTVKGRGGRALSCWLIEIIFNDFQFSISKIGSVWMISRRQQSGVRMNLYQYSD